MELELIKAVQSGDMEAVRHLLAKGVDVNSQDDALRGTALMYAAAKGAADTVSLLLEAGADIEIRNKHGRNALMEAARGGNEHVVELLLNHGAEV